ncbi:VOC family protein [Brevibacterium renqingii]|uniref:VOC family protein n=1 Tax=Brevibacterium renqingii TaxID=2776916 RepID=UPI001AE0865A|nr:VOC family protein [Brevibacterium renqingii]
MESTFRGVFLTCTDAEATAAFYREIAGLPLEAAGDEDYTYFVFELDGVQIALHGAEAFADYTFPPVAESNLTHLYFRIPDQAEFLERIRHAGTPLVDVDEVVVTVEDPDGRKVMFGTA